MKFRKLALLIAVSALTAFASACSTAMMDRTVAATGEEIESNQTGTTGRGECYETGCSRGTASSARGF